MAIITTAQYKSYAGISVSTYDTQLNVLIPAIQAQLEDICDRSFDTGTFTEYIDGAGSPTIGVRCPPIASVTSVQLIDRSETVVYTYDATSYKVDSAPGLISRQVSGFGGTYNATAPLPSPMPFERQPQFPDGWRNIKVVYVGAYGASPGTAVPASLQLLMYQLVDAAFAQIGQDRGLKSETLGHYKYDRFDGSFWSQFKEQIQHWKRVAS